MAHELQLLPFVPQCLSAFVPSSSHHIQATRAAAWAKLFVLIMIIGLLGLLARVVQLKLGADPRLAQVVGAPISSRPERAPRGDLLDRRGRVIATSTLGYRLFVDPQVIGDRETIAVDLADLIDCAPLDIDRRILRRPESRYVVISQLLDDSQVDRLRRANLRGVGIEPRPVRRYPHGDLAAAVVGRVGVDHVGLTGLEYRLDDQLAPRPGRLRYLRDARRRAMWIDAEGYEPPKAGRDVRLSLDLVVQETARRHLQRAVDRHAAAGGRVVVLDCRTGELLAVADIVNPDPANAPVSPRDGSAGPPSGAVARNRCVTDPYEPGSTFKPFIWAVATELGKASPDEVLPTPAPGTSPYRTSRGRRIRDVHPRGPATWSTVLVKSLNSGMAIVAERMTDHEMQEAIARFGFGATTACGLPGESAGLLTPPKRWSHYTQTSVPMGHEIAVTAVQMVRAFSVFARDGTMPALRITALRPRDERFPFVCRVLSEPVAAAVRAALRKVVTEGTGRAARSRTYRIFGKSGTPQLPRPDGGGYYEDRYRSTFIGAAPLESPRIVVLCVIDDPERSTGYFGGATAGPVVRDIIDETLAYLGVPGDEEKP